MRVGSLPLLPNPVGPWHLGRIGTAEWHSLLCKDGGGVFFSPRGSIYSDPLSFFLWVEENSLRLVTAFLVVVEQQLEQRGW